MTFEAMSQGAFHEGVADLKGRLLFLGVLAPPVDTWFDDRTETAVRTYQHSVGHATTGTVDAALWAQLVADSDAYGYSLDQARAGAYDAHFAPDRYVEEAPAAEPAHPEDPAHAAAHDAELRSVLRNLSTRVLAFAGEHAQAIDSACKHFVEDYARPRLKQLDRRLTGEDYGKYLTRHLGGSALVGLTKIMAGGLAATGVGAAGSFVITSIWIGFSMNAERQMATAVHDALSDHAELDGAITHFVTVVPDRVGASVRELRHALDHEIDAVFDRINHHQELDERTLAWVNPLLTAGPTATDAVIEHTFGIPTDYDSVRVQVYELLVESFEKMVLDKFDTPSLLERVVTPLLQDAAPGVDLEARQQQARDREHAARAHEAATEAARQQRH